MLDYCSPKAVNITSVSSSDLIYQLFSGLTDYYRNPLPDNQAINSFRIQYIIVFSKVNAVLTQLLLHPLVCNISDLKFIVKSLDYLLLNTSRLAENEYFICFANLIRFRNMLKIFIEHNSLSVSTKL